MCEATQRDPLVCRLTILVFGLFLPVTPPSQLRPKEGGSMKLGDTFTIGVRSLARATRRLRGAPGFALAVIASFTLGIGVNAVVFEIVDRLLLSPPRHVCASLSRIRAGRRLILCWRGARRYGVPHAIKHDCANAHK